MGTNDTLIDTLSQKMSETEYPGISKILSAMRKVDRGLFVNFPNPELNNTYMDEVVQIGEDQTCSKPFVVAEMAWRLELSEGLKVLEVGTGCGYSAAVTSMLIGSKGKFITLEISPTLVILAQDNLRTLFGDELFKRIIPIAGSGYDGYPLRAPYDRIYFTAGVDDIHNINIDKLKTQLNNGGIILIPEQDGPMHKYKLLNNDLSHEEINSYRFVPLRK